MVFKANIVEERLAFLREILARLRALQGISKEDFLRDGEKQWSVERGLQLAAETLFDIGSHILAGKFQERVAGYDLILPALVRHGVVSDDLAYELERLGGFRNILVHEYLGVDLEKIYDRLHNGLDDFALFIQQVAAWLNQ